MPRSKLSPKPDTCNSLVIGLGVFCIVAVVGAVVVLAVHLQLDTQWKQELNEIAAGNEKLTSDLKKAEDTVKMIGDKDIVSAHRDLTAKYAKTNEEIEKKTAKNTKLTESLEAEAVENAKLLSGIQKANENIAELQNITSALLKQTQSSQSSGLEKLQETQATLKELQMNFTTALVSHSVKQTEMSAALIEAKKDVTEMEKIRSADMIANEEKFNNLTRKMAASNERIGVIETMIKDPCPIKYQGSCYWVEVRYGRVTLEQAKGLCSSQGGKAANFYSEDHYYMLLGYLRIFASRGGHIEAYLGMTYNKVDNKAYLSDGKLAPYDNWFPDHPHAPHCCEMAMHVDMDWTHARQGVLSIPAGNSLRAVICEK